MLYLSFFNLFAADDDYVSSLIFNPVRGGRLCAVFTTVHLRGVIIACLFGIKHYRVGQ